MGYGGGLGAVAGLARRSILGGLARCGYLVVKKDPETHLHRANYGAEIAPAKRLILDALERRGYLIVKRRDRDAAQEAVASRAPEEAAAIRAERGTAAAQRAAEEAAVRRVVEEATARRAAEEAEKRAADELRAAEELAATPANAEASLRAQLEIEPDRIDLLQRLYAVLEEQAKPIPLELQDQVLTVQLEEFPDRPDLRERLERVHYKRRKLSRERMNEITLADFREGGEVPGNLYLQITNDCNLRCAMCAHKTATKDHSFMDDALFQRCLDQAAEHKIGSAVFAAAYGEALLHPKAMQYLKESVARGFQVILSMNGNYFLPADQIRELATLGLDLIQYSFFGFDKASYEKTYVGGKFEKASENLRLLKAALVANGASTRLSVNGVNITNDPDRTLKTREYLRTLGIQDSEMRLLAPCNFGGQISPGVRSEKIHGKSFKPIDRLPLYVCPLLLSTPGVLTDGRMTACGCVDNNGSLTIGDIRTQSIAQMRSGERFQSMINAFVEGDLSKFPLCAKCDIPYGNLHGEYNEPSA
jgi:sulfatase maturation enzyme AslB (radical SAM superfamily)